MRILITGGTGFLGTNLYQWVRRNHPEVEVSIASRRTGIDIRDYEQIKKVIKGQDYVVHCAAQTHVDFSLHGDLEDQLNFVDTNVKGALHVIKACEKHKVKLIYISTSEVYGSDAFPGKPMDEDHPLNAQAGIYAVTKLAADRLCRMETLTQGADTVIVRPFNFWGPGQSVEKLIPRLINQGMNKQPLTVYGTGLQKRDYVYIQDVCSAIWELKDWDNSIFNVASGESLTILEIANLIADYFKVPITHVEARPGEVIELHGDIDKITSLTSWKPTTFVNKTTMKGVIEWYLENKPIQQPVL